MFDMLTRDELSHLHEALYHTHQRIMRKLVDDNHRPIVEVGGLDWTTLRAAANEVHETMSAVYAEGQRRDREAGIDA